MQDEAKPHAEKQYIRTIAITNYNIKYENYNYVKYVSNSLLSQDFQHVVFGVEASLLELLAIHGHGATAPSYYDA